MNRFGAAILAIMRRMVNDGDDVLEDVYNLQDDCPAELDQAVRAWKDAGCPVQDVEPSEERRILTAEEVSNSRPRGGDYICRTCGFVLQTNFLNPTTGAVGTDSRLKAEPCPNGHGVLDQRTELDCIVSLDEACEAMTEKLYRGRWHRKSERPDRHGVVALLALDVGDNTGAGLDECWTIAWWDSTAKPAWRNTDEVGAWRDVHSPRDDGGLGIGPWISGWKEIEQDRPRWERDGE